MTSELESSGGSLKLLLEEQHALEQPKPRLAAIGSVITHIVIFGVLLVIPWGPAGPPPERDVSINLKKVTPLIAPPMVLTQRDKGTGKVSPDLTLQGLIAKPTPKIPPPPQTSMTRPASPKPFEAPAAQAAPAPKPMIEAPKIEEGKREPADLVARATPPGAGTVQESPVNPTPQIQVQEKPKLAFERPGGVSSGAGSGTVQSKIPIPQHSSMEETIRQAAHGNMGGMTVGDVGEGIGGLGESLRNPRAPVKNASSLELLSDPMGVDFKPYLIRVLAAVRRNWRSVIPESARLGRRGKVAIQFSIARAGDVPKLVIATASGTEALDRAAVAGISASNPFPPLPDEFKGQQIRLQLTFLYNIPAR